MDFNVPQDICFAHANELSIKDVTEVLLALDSLVKRAVHVSTYLRPDLEGARCSVALKNVASGSLIIDLIFKFIPNSKIEKLAEDYQNMPASEFFKSHNILLPTILILIVIHGWKYAVAIQSPQAQQQQILYAEKVVFATAKEDGLDPERIQSLIKATQHDSIELAKESVRLVKPFKEDGAASFTLGKSLKIAPEVLREVPERVEEPYQYESYSERPYGNSGHGQRQKR